MTDKKIYAGDGWVTSGDPDVMMAVPVSEFWKLVNDKPTLRDQFAMAALTGILSRMYLGEKPTAHDAYKYADAMLKAREE